MPASQNGSYVSRFVLKFIEIIAAGLATAVSGYLIAHLSGVMSSPGPAPAATVIQVAPTASTVSSESGPTASTSPSAPVPASIPTASTGSSAPAQPAAPTASVGSESLAVPTAPTSAPSNPHDIGAPAATQAGRKAVSTTRSEPARKSIETAVTAAPIRPQQDSFVSQVRAALRNVEADRAEPVLPPQGTSTAPAAPAPLAQPGHAIDLARPTGPSGTAAAVQSSSVAPSLGAPVEIDSRPIAEAQSPATPPTEKDTGVLSTLEQMLRQDPLAGTDEAPRPPLPVGR